MKQLFATTIFILSIATITSGQKLTQTVRGTIIDADSKMPLIGVAVGLFGSNPLIGTSTDVYGNFRLENIAVGRITVQLFYIGYENKTIPNLMVNSGKETILNLSMRESIKILNVVEVKATEKKGEAVNEMAIISARSVSMEEASRYALAFNDPSRIASNFAGVANSADGNNDVIVRGNSPKYMQWRLEGVEITNPNHFADQSGIGGGISALNNNLLATSDFYTGAFSPEFGDALSGVYDIRLRSGNNEKTEATFGFGIMGTDLTIEGPLKKGYAGSYLINYRYSVAGIIQAMGLLKEIEGSFTFQDAAFKINLPTKKAGVFSIFGLGGLSGIELVNITPDLKGFAGNNSLQHDITRTATKLNYLMNVGVNHTISINKNNYIKTTLSFSGDGMNDNVYQSKILKQYNVVGEFLSDSTGLKTLNFKSRLKKYAYRGAIKYSNKINARNNLQVGVKYSLFDHGNTQSWLNDILTKRISLVSFNENIVTLRNYISWKHRLTKEVTIVSGLHNMNVLTNNKSTLEPRLAINWKLNNINSLSAGYGKHSTMESVLNYFTQIEDENGNITEPNRDLDLLKAHHFVVGYERRFSENLVAKVEAYYQYLYDLPVENNDTSYYATINEALDFKYVDLVNKGTGENYGIEFTLERFFNNNFYYLINGSLFSSTYKSLEGVKRNTMYNGNYMVNVLAGKEFANLGKKKNRTLAINAKIFYGGGKKIVPLLRDNQGNVAVDSKTGNYWDYDKAYEDKLGDVYQINVSLSYKFNRSKTTHEIFMVLDNITNTRGVLSEYYSEGEPNSIGYGKQFGFFPNLMYKVHF